MKDSINTKLEQLERRFEELSVLLSDAEVISNQALFRQYSKEYTELEAVVTCYSQYKKAENDRIESELLLKENLDADIKELAREELTLNAQLCEQLSDELEIILLPKDPRDNCNIFLEIRAGTGGDEASLFSGDLFRMYSRFAENQNWQIEIISSNPGDKGGYKEIITRISGKSVYAKLKFESGAHRVQRVPETESQGRVHTSACTVAILPEPDEQAKIELKKDDLRIDTFRSSGAGGQHVNTTDSAIRITHLSTGMVVECQDERSQHKNKAKAMALLSARLADAQATAQMQEIADQRKSLVGSGDRSERIRTYNFPQGRVTDHRINLTLYKLAEVIQGELSPIIEPLMNEHQVSLLAALSANN